jgi:hypothetical protein
MLEPLREPRFALEIDEEMLVHRTLVRNLQRHTHAVDGVDGFVDRRDRPVVEATLDAVLAEFLSGFQHFPICRWFRCRVVAPVRSGARCHRPL